MTRADAAAPERSGSPARTAAGVDLTLASPLFHPAYAGPARRFRGYAPGFRERGVAMDVFTATPAADAPDGRAAEAGAEREPGAARRGGAAPDADVALDRVDDIPVRRLRMEHAWGTKRGWWEYQRRLVELCGGPRTRPDVLQLLTVDPWSAWYLFRLRRLGVPTVYTRTMLSRRSSRWWKRALQRLYWPLPYRWLDCTVVSSSVMRDGLREIGVRGRVEVIPNGTDTRTFRPASEAERRELRRELGLPPGAPVVLFVGSISPRKGVDVLAEAWGRIARRHPDARLLLVGPRHDEIRPDEDVGDFFGGLERSLEEGAGTGRVVFTGAVDDVADHYRAADVFVFPSRKEGMPNVVPEAYACGLPVVMTPFQGLPEEFGRAGEHHLLVQRGPGPLAEAVHRLLDDSAERRRIGRKARRWAERELALETALDRYAELYRELSRGADAG